MNDELAGNETPLHLVYPCPPRPRCCHQRAFNGSDAEKVIARLGCEGGSVSHTQNDWARYLAWNSAISAYFFNPDRAFRPVYLQVDSSVLKTTAPDPQSGQPFGEGYFAGVHLRPQQPAANLCAIKQGQSSSRKSYPIAGAVPSKGILQ